MARLSSVEEFRELAEIIMTERKADKSIPRIVICAGTACQASGSNDIIKITKKYILQKKLQNKISLKITGCHGFCEMGPFILTEPQRAFYHKVSIKNVNEIIDAVIANGYAEGLLYSDPKTKQIYYSQDEIPFFNKQKRTILNMNQKIDPIRIFDYIANGGYKAVENIFSRFTPQEVIEEIKLSGLRGRGGAGFPAGKKWEMLAKQTSKRGKYIVCNADEGDPGAYMDRSLLEGNPHGIIEGMIVGAYATGASEGVVYVRNEYPLAIKHLVIALRQARDFGLLGKNVLGSNFSFDIQIAKGAGAFVCGEETALMRSVEGKVGEPGQRPPYPVQKGINGNPTIINNVESWANIATIINDGAKNFVKIGTKGNSGTKIFSLVGKIKNTGLIEVPMGISIKDIVFKIGGGPSGSAKIKAVQTGGPSGGCIPVEQFDLPIDYDSLAKAGSIMGSGGMIVMDENTCMVDVARYFMTFLKDESCGKCFTCRKGTQRMYEILDDISKGKATLEQLDLLEELARVVKDTTMCGLGQTAANPVLSTLQHFRHEYSEHIVNKRCPAGVCKELVGAPCQDACPLGTEAWRYIAHITRGEYEKAYIAIREPNPFPSVCARVCSHPCEFRCRMGSTGGEPIAIRSLKRFVTDNVDPSVFQQPEIPKTNKDNKVAIIGAGPAGLTAAHYLSLNGYKVTVFEKDSKAGGMLNACIPIYRMPRDILQKEIDSLLNENIELKLNSPVGLKITIDSLLKEGYKAVFLAIGAHKSSQLGLAGENTKGVYSSLDFLKSFNKKGENLAKGHVGIIGGGDSAIDSARVSLRQKEVKSVTIYYRRTYDEMPALKDEIDEAVFEGVSLKTLVSPVKISTDGKRLEGIECVTNELGDVDASGRNRPVPITGSEHLIPLDTLIVAVGDKPEVAYIDSSSGLKVNNKGIVKVDKDTLATNRSGVFAGGDVITGPDTVVQAIAAGKKAAVMIGRYCRGEKLHQTPVINLPTHYVEPVSTENDQPDSNKRAKQPITPLGKRKNSFEEVELTLSAEQARLEAGRCMRCDLEFTSNQASEDEYIELGA